MNLVLKLYDIMTAFSRPTDNGLWWETQSYGVSTAEYMVGYAGLVPTLVRVYDPSRPDPLTLAAFSAKSGTSGCG